MSENQEIAQLRKDLNKDLAELSLARATRKQESCALKIVTADRDGLRDALSLAQGVAEGIQESAHRRVSEVVSRSLSAVFAPDEYAFKIRFEQKRGHTEATLLFVRDGVEVDPLTAAGGGVVQVAALALRVSVLLLARPQVRRLLVMDEPLSQLSAEYVPRARELILALAEEFKIQIVMVTHQAGLACGNVVRL